MDECFDNRKKIMQIKTFISTKGELVDERVNGWIAEESEKGSIVSIYDIKPFLSYTTIKDKGAYMVGCMIEYLKVVEEENDENDESN